MEPECERIGLDEALDRLRGYRLRGINPNLLVTLALQELQWELRDLREAVERGLTRKFFMYLPASDVMYYEQEALFGPEVAVKFPGAAEDIKEAGNCYAMGNNTACVMHLMRVLELGLQSLAKTLKIRFNHSNWGTLINNAEKKIGIIEKRKRKPGGWRSDRQFYYEAAKEFRYIKDAWRNYAMHVHVHYDRPQALSVMNHVRELMQHLATRIKG